MFVLFQKVSALGQWDEIGTSLNSFRFLMDHIGFFSLLIMMTEVAASDTLFVCNFCYINVALWNGNDRYTLNHT